MSAGRPLLVAIGSPLRCDDGVGPAVAERVADAHADVRVLTVQALVPELADDAARADLVIFVDADAQAAAGEVRCRRVRPDATAASGHTLTPAHVLALAQQVFDRCPKSYLVSVGGARWGFGTRLSSEVSAAVPTAVGTVARLLAEPRSRTARRT